MGRIARFACLLSLIVVALANNCYGQVSNTWSSAGQMSQARTGAAAVLLRDGRVLITGGSDASGLPMASAEFFSPTAGAFSPAPAMNVARANHAAILLADGEVLVTGGATSGGAYSDTAEIYNPATQQWTLLDASLGTGRTGHAMALLTDGNVLIAGGESTSGPVATLQLFITADHSITSIGSLITARTDAAAAATPDGRVLIAGGTDSNNNILASTEIFVYVPSTLTGSISAGPAMSYARSAATATSTYDGVAIIGGYDVQNGTQADLGTAEIFSQWTNAFRVVSGATPRSGHFAVMLPANGSILAMGGTGGQAVDLLQPWANSLAGAFLAAAGSQSSHSGGFAASAGLGALLAAGGQGSAASAAELYWFPTISTDQPDYAPGTQVLMTGTGFQPGETVDLHLHEWVNQTTTDTPDYKVTALSDGTFSFSGYAPTSTDAGARYHLTAVGETSAFQAQTIFTDAAPYALTIQVNPAGGSPNANSVTAGTTNGGSDVIGACTSGTGCSGSESTNNVNLYITATSGTGYAFSSWAFASGSTPTGCDSNPSPNICVIKSSNNKSATVTANFNVATSTTKFTNLTASQSISYGATSITLSGKLTGSPVNPPSGSTIGITINGMTTDTTITDAAGDFSASITTSALNASTTPYTITYSYAATNNFNATSDTSTALTVNQMQITLTAGSYSGTYDGNTHALSDCTSSAPTFVACTNTPAGPVGPDATTSPQTVTPSPNYVQGNSADYTLTSNNGSWSITPLAVTLTGGSYSAVYDGNSHALSTCTSSSTLLSCTNNPVGPVGPDVVSAPVPVSPVPVYGSANAADFSITSNNGSWSITPLPVTLHAGSYSGTYDASTHALSACTSNESSFVTCANNPVGPVGPGVGSGSVSPTPSYPKGIPADYDLTSQNGSWSITTAAISATLTAHDRTYDGTTSEPNNNMSCSLAGVFAADAGNISCTPTDGTFASADVGTWTVSATVTISGGAAGNYTLGAAGTALNSTLATASASITPLALALTAGGYTGIYDGSTHALSGCTSSAPAFVTCTNNPAGPVGPDAVVTPQTVTPTPKYVQGNSGDYTITNNNSSWSITPLAVTLTGGSYSAVYDGNSHALSTCTSSSTLLTCTNAPAGPVGPDVVSTPVSVSPVPVYGSAIAADFSITSNNGSWSITPLAVTISAGSYNGVYDGNTHALSACASTAPAFLTCANDPAGPVGPDAAASPQTVIPAPKYVQGSAADYTLTSNNGSWSITPLAITLTAGSYSGAYDGTSHTLTSCTSSSPLFVTCTNDPAGPEKNAGTGTVTPVLSIIQGISGDYAITDKNGSWNITPVPLTITSDSKSIILDGTLPTFTATYNGFVGGEGPTALAGTLSCTAGTNGQSIGTFTITCSGQTSTNYSIVYNNIGKLTVTYAAVGGICDGDVGHQILQPIMSGSVFKSNSTTPAKFRVCDAKGVSIGTPGVVSSFVLVSVTNGTVTTADETVGSTTPDAAFRWDPTGQQWIFNISNSSLATSFGTNKTFTFLITLNDGTIIPFQYGLR